jgi:hypothetical protein
MGCGASKQSASTLHELAPRPKPGGGFTPEPDLSRTELENALRWTAEHIVQHSKKAITIVAIGGVVNTISLRTRSATHDVDWFHNSLPPEEMKLLKNAANYAVQQGSRHGR